MENLWRGVNRPWRKQKFELILALTNRGAAMRSWPPPDPAGATGGPSSTWMLGGQEADRFLGIQLQRRRSWWPFGQGEYKVPIMQTIAKQSRPPDSAETVVLSCLWIPWKACGKQAKRVCYKLCFLQQTPSKVEAAGEHTGIRVFSRSNILLNFFKKQFCSGPACKIVQFTGNSAKTEDLTAGPPAGGRTWFRSTFQAVGCGPAHMHRSRAIVPLVRPGCPTLRPQAAGRSNIVPGRGPKSRRENPGGMVVTLCEFLAVAHEDGCNLRPGCCALGDQSGLPSCPG